MEQLPVISPISFGHILIIKVINKVRYENSTKILRNYFNINFTLRYYEHIAVF